MDKYEVFVSVEGRPREMFRIRATSLEEVVDEVNSRYDNIIESSAIRIDENGNRTNLYFNLNEGKVIL